IVFPCTALEATDRILISNVSNIVYTTTVADFAHFFGEFPLLHKNLDGIMGLWAAQNGRR
ncbi:MAG: hypothetical protein AAFQ63_11495, partial [Cyanobacteria bacterium J06621_11]